MKKFITFVVLIFIQSVCYSQTYTTNYCSYYYDLSGFWKGNVGDDTLRIFLKSQRRHASQLSSEDIIYGYHELKKVGLINQSNITSRNEVIDTNWNKTFNDIPNYAFSFSLLGNCIPYQDTLYGSFKDLSKNQRFGLTVYVLNATTIKFRQDYTEGFEFINGSPQSGFTVPREIILYKE